MKMFWEILGTKKKMHTGFALAYVVDKKTGKRYEVGVGKMRKKKDYPKNLIEDLWDFQTHDYQYELYYGVAAKQEPDRIEKTRQGIRKVYSSAHPKELEKEYLNVFGLWEIKGLGIYTDKAIDVLRDKETGKEYLRGERKLFYNEDETPFPLAEHTNRYEYIYLMNDTGGLSVEDSLQEISSWFTTKALFGKR